MTSSAVHHVEGCDLRALGSEEVVLLSRCWRLERVTMTHHEDGTVDLALRCEAEQCLCAQALKKSKAVNAAAPGPRKSYRL